MRHRGCGMNAALSWFDWRTFAAMLGIVGAVALLISWQHRTDKQRGALWLGHSALSLEVLGLALSVFWAATAPDGAILPLVFVAGWAGMLVGRAVGITAAVSAWQSTPRRGGQFALTVSALIVAYLALYASGLFHAVNDAGNAAQARLEASRPAQSLDAEIEATRARLSALAGFADAGKAHTEEQAQAAASQAQQARLAELQATRDQARASAAQWANPDCSPKTDSKGRPYTARAAEACAQIQAAQAAFDRAAQPSSAAGAGYSARHTEYNGVQAHLLELEKQRTALSASGQGAINAWLPEDEFISWAFGITPQQASRIKWLVFTAIFDIASLLFRIIGAVWGGTDNASRAAVHRFAALVSAGLSPDEAADILRRGAPPRLDALLGPPKETGKDLGVPGVVYRDRERVPLELSQTAGRGRVGKVDTCKDCGEDFPVDIYNATRCKACSEKAQASFRAHKARLKA